MRVALALLAVLLAGCAQRTTLADGDPGQSAAWREHQAQIDAVIIMQGMNQARMQSEALARRAP
ncbi:MAG: hypothetical protein M3Y41_13845 [Pseudomonadota bacterium]|nr:hypothetical protein [Pseudomonadota bacterium]